MQIIDEMKRTASTLADQRAVEILLLARGRLDLKPEESVFYKLRRKLVRPANQREVDYVICVGRYIYHKLSAATAQKCGYLVATSDHQGRALSWRSLMTKIESGEEYLREMMTQLDATRSEPPISPTYATRVNFAMLYGPGHHHKE